MGFQAPITISRAIQAIQANEYVLPAIQREFVWTPEQIEKLFDSLVRGYPIGSFLFWKIDSANLQQYQLYRFMDRYHQRDHTHNEPLVLVGAHPLTAVLDGQQRLTALNIGLKGYYASKVPWARWNSNHAFPERFLYLNVLKQANGESELAYEFEMLRASDVKASGPDTFWFPVSDILKFNSIEKVFFYCVEMGLAKEGQQYPSVTLMKLWRVIKDQPLINYYLEEEQDLDKVLNIFIRVNSGGTTLSYSDMLLSIATAQWQQKDARKEIHGIVDELNRIGDGFNFNKDFVLKASLVLADIPAIEFRVGSFTRDTMLKIESVWDEIVDALRLAAALVESWGYNWQTLTSNNAVIPLAYYLYQRDCPSHFMESASFQNDRAVMRRWLTVALLKRAFSGQPDSALRPIRRILHDNHGAFPLDTLLAEFRATPRSLEFSAAEIEGLLDYTYGDNYVFSVLALLYPWLQFDQHFHIDHIFPRAMFTPKVLAAKGIPPDQWHRWLGHFNDLANLQLLQGTLNQEKSSRDFSEWLTGTCPTPQAMQAYRENPFLPI